jgi:hypothetical protein
VFTGSWEMNFVNAINEKCKGCFEFLKRCCCRFKFSVMLPTFRRSVVPSKHR